VRIDDRPGSLLLPLDVRDHAFSRLERWTAMSSASDDAEGLERLAAALAAEGEALGLVARIERESDEDGRSLPLLELRTQEISARPLLLIGHIDTVLPAARPRRDGDRFFATGAIDMKGGLAAGFGALELLASRGGRASDLRIVLTPDEEVGGAISRRAVERFGAAARALWVLEPGDRTASGETLVVGRRGLFHWRLEARGRASHSGAQFWKGRSATAAAAEWCVEAAALSRPHSGPTVNLARIVGGDRQFVERLAESAARLGTPRELNVVPDRTVVEGEVRFVRAGEEHELQTALRDAARRISERTGVTLRFRRAARIAPVDSEGLDRTWPERAIASATAAGWNLEIEPTRGGVSFPNFLPEPGKIPVLDGLGPVGGGMHTREEHVELVSLERRIALLADLLELDAAEATAVQSRPASAVRSRARTGSASTSR
jgi:glutamate carboxypeptidase